MFNEKRKRICGDKCKDECGNCSMLGGDGLPVQCVGPWVEDKYSLLERYLDATRYARKKFSDNGNAVFVDLFAGPGRCIIKNEKREILNGAMRVVTELSIPFSEHYLIDICPTNEKALKSRLGDRIGCSVLCKDSNNYAKVALICRALKENLFYIKAVWNTLISASIMSKDVRMAALFLAMHS
jgi:hypothetical protein